MELINEIYKRGTSSLPGYRLDYSVKYVGESVKTITAQVKKLSEADGVNQEKWVGNCMYDLGANRYVVSFTNSAAVTAQDRAAIFADFEKTIQALV